MRDMTNTSSALQSRVGQYMSQVYLWMMVGFVLTSGVTFYINATPTLLKAVLTTPAIFYGVIVLQLAAVFSFAWLQNRLSTAGVAALYLAYAALTGVTFAIILQIYTRSNITLAFLATAGSFGALSIYGFVTKKDLSAWRTFLFMGLVGLIIVSFASIFMTSLQVSTVQMTLGAIGVIVFAGLTAYDTQRIKATYLAGYGNNKTAIAGALSLYLDFINLFISFLRLFAGGQR